MYAAYISTWDDRSRRIIKINANSKEEAVKIMKNNGINTDNQWDDWDNCWWGWEFKNSLKEVLYWYPRYDKEEVKLEYL